MGPACALVRGPFQWNHRPVAPAWLFHKLSNTILMKTSEKPCYLETLPCDSLLLPPHVSFPIGLWAIPGLFIVAILTQKGLLDEQGSCSFGMMDDGWEIRKEFCLSFIFPSPYETACHPFLQMSWELLGCQPRSLLGMKLRVFRA